MTTVMNFRHIAVLFTLLLPRMGRCFQVTNPFVAVVSTNSIHDDGGDHHTTVTADRSIRNSFLATRMYATESAPSGAATVTRLENSAVLIAIPVPGLATQAAYDKVCTELSKSIQVPGFRKGSKLPPQLLEQSMAAKGGRNALKIQAINELLSTLVEPALRGQALDPIGQPRLSPSADVLADSYQPGQPLSLTVECDVWPEIKWTGEYTGLTGTYQRKPVDVTKLNKALSDLQERYATMEPIEDEDHVLKIGDACVVNMVGYMETASGKKGEPLPNAASGDRVEVILGSGRYMEGLVEGLTGAKVGDTVVVRVTFPDVRDPLNIFLLVPNHHPYF
jgi:trigger factor